MVGITRRCYLPRDLLTLLSTRRCLLLQPERMHTESEVSFLCVWPDGSPRKMCLFLLVASYESEVREVREHLWMIGPSAGWRRIGLIGPSVIYLVLMENQHCSGTARRTTHDAQRTTHNAHNRTCHLCSMSPWTVSSDSSRQTLVAVVGVGARFVIA